MCSMLLTFNNVTCSSKSLSSDLPRSVPCVPDKTTIRLSARGDKLCSQGGKEETLRRIHTVRDIFQTNCQTRVLSARLSTLRVRAFFSSFRNQRALVIFHPEEVCIAMRKIRAWLTFLTARPFHRLLHALMSLTARSNGGTRR